MKDLIKKYLLESGMITGGYPDDGSTGPASDDDMPPGNIVWGPRYKRGEYYNKLTPYNSIWRHDEEGGWYWNWFENSTGMDDPDNYSEDLKKMKDLFPDDTWNVAWRAIRKNDVPDKEVDRRFDIKGQPYRDSDDVIGKHDDAQGGESDMEADVPDELDASKKGVSEMGLIDRMNKFLIGEVDGIGDSPQNRKAYGNVGGEVGASGGSAWPSTPPEKPYSNKTTGKKKKKKGTVSEKYALKVMGITHGWEDWDSFDSEEDANKAMQKIMKKPGFKSGKNKVKIIKESKISETIYKQINSLDKFAFPSWGAKSFVGSDKSLQFDVRGSRFRGRVIITYDRGKDLYSIEFGNVVKLDWKSKKIIEPVFAGDLVNVLDGQIG